ncbi:putative permease, cadmium resistance protein [Mycolicibacterium chubuense NBB4]|uniref:Putative permease, cadmium resistance protein n=1 Tax=Mycolicibacterium chubuense (strain NBB4) TaxID=710421 RepID=I4BJ20_MYCCN|nr:cadmium resistance transporter [Mycolicibacterium chubuense]AFM17277.1 putative permease, cadmium resistance protein [Mycolicibacterium chubuense NBB4]
MLLQAVGLFLGTNVDSFVILLAFFSQANGDTAANIRVVIGQFLGFSLIVLACALGAAGLAQVLSGPATAYLGLVPLAMGLWQVRRIRPASRTAPGAAVAPEVRAPEVWQVTVATLADGGDNVAAYLPFFAVIGINAMVACSLVFLAGAAVMCALAWLICDYSPLAQVLRPVRRVAVPAVLIVVGLAILVHGRAFGL